MLLIEVLEGFRWEQKDEDGFTETLILQNGKSVGRVASMPDGMQTMKFKQLGYGSNPEVRRISEIWLDNSLHNKGLGQVLYLKEMARFPKSWFYNSQASQMATKSLLSMQKKGLIELSEFGGRLDDEFTAHAKRITPAGIKAVDNFHFA